MYLAVVGFGDLFIRPLEIREGIQSDGKSRFMIEKFNDQDYALLMSSDGESFYEKYRFNLEEVPVERFADICLEKQTSPASYFVKNTICTKPTSLGRLTLKNDKFIEKKANQRTEKLIRNDDELRIVLKNNNGIVIR